MTAAQREKQRIAAAKLAAAGRESFPLECGQLYLQPVNSAIAVTKPALNEHVIYANLDRRAKKKLQEQRLKEQQLKQQQEEEEAAARLAKGSVQPFKEQRRFQNWLTLVSGACLLRE